MTYLEKLSWLNNNKYFGRCDWYVICWPMFNDKNGIKVFTLDDKPVIVNNDHFTPWLENFPHAKPCWMARQTV